MLSYYTITVGTYMKRHKLLSSDDYECLPADAFEPESHVNYLPCFTPYLQDPTVLSRIARRKTGWGQQSHAVSLHHNHHHFRKDDQ
jgi:hypothetical protein